jgi:hypothetical protein
MPTLNERLRDAVRDNYDPAEVRLPADPEDIDFEKDEFETYWVTARVAISPYDLDYNPNPFYSVWECEDFSEANDWSDVSDWRLDELFQCESDDDAGSCAKRLAHDRARHLRKGMQRIVYAVRPGNQPPKPLPHPRFTPADAGDSP